MNLNQPFKIKLEILSDKRGFLTELYSQKKTKLKFKHSIFSTSKKNVIRGFHFRIKPEIKILYVLEGKINDYCINLNKNGKKKIYRFNLKPKEGLFIPSGFAHGYECLEEKNDIIYFLSDNYKHHLQSGIIWNDKKLNIKWKIKKPILSFRDKDLLSYKEIKLQRYY